ncbi:MAG: hypothetical protein JRM80_01225 [Nitrososphaerota archaeon]|nr:hypothetical protein [Nitrososphaerota archaeon]MDG6956897.1 hypothetical protein [Nitrososphaerota archaeon]MDG6960214.1 hypothetical protein [Nitrososphaerota archaeon]MDG6962235.1 hypothetical protein [Nitrososphaerota archaeon]MDG6973039.1 hypothetical protein [Nitrososphaerota archaeon]
MGADQSARLIEGEELGSLGLRGLRMTLSLSYANFVMYFMLLVTGMFVNIFITSGVSTVGISNPSNLVHMLFAIGNFSLTFVIMMVGLVYGMKKVAMYSFGAIVALVAATAGGALFLVTGGSRVSGSITLAAGWEMSLLFMLAIFLSYYATLKIMRAVRLIEALAPKTEAP